MVLTCPQCEAKVVTVTGYPLATVTCGNCGTEINVPSASENAGGASQRTESKPDEKSWWRRLFGW
jgi:hypothetical protein